MKGPRTHRDRLRSSQLALLAVFSLVSFLAPASSHAQADEESVLRLMEGRFELSLERREAGGSPLARTVPWSRQAGYFWFFESANVEVVVKMIDGAALNDHFWLFFATLTGADVRLEVLDRLSGERRSYRPAGPWPSSAVDLEAFRSDSAAADRPFSAPLVGTPPSASAIRHTSFDHEGEPPLSSFCDAGPHRLCLAAGRFQVEASFWPAAADRPRLARATSSTAKAGAFSFFSADNPEIVVKVLDGRPLNRSFWVIVAPLTTLEWELRVTDTASGRIKTYRRPAAKQQGVADLHAFVDSAHPPRPPVITEPDIDGQKISVADVHMETAPFFDPDPEDQHYCSDFEIWQMAGEPPKPFDKVWGAGCVIGLIKNHIHLGDGRFSGGRAGKNYLAPGPHLLRVRHRDDTGVSSPRSERFFVGGFLARVFPLRSKGLLAVGPWTASEKGELELRGGERSPQLKLESATGELLFLRTAGPGGPVVELGSELAETEPLRLVVTRDLGGPVELPESEISIVDLDGSEHTLYLPSLLLDTGQRRMFWIAENGSTYLASEGSSAPELDRLARHTPRPWALRQAGFELDLVAEGFQLPVNIAFVPEPSDDPSAPFFYVSELHGTIKVVSRDGTVSDFATDLLNFTPSARFPGSGEIGLAGLLVEPGSGDLLATTVYRTDPADPRSHYSGRLIRLQSVDGGRRAGGLEVLLDLAPDALSASHQISDVTLGPDGKLYLQVGDGLQPMEAGNLHSFLGKVLRLEPDGTAPTDNPFYDETDGIDPTDYVFAYGFRNPFGGAWRAKDGHLYQVENGPSVDRLARVEPRLNYSWDLDRDGVGTNYEMTERAIYNWGSPPHAPANLVFVQTETQHGSGFPATHLDRAFVAEFGQAFFPGRTFTGKRISELTLDEHGELIAGPVPLVEYEGYARTSIVALAAGPDGLYFGEFFIDDPENLDPTSRGSRIWRVRAKPGAVDSSTPDAGREVGAAAWRRGGGAPRPRGAAVGRATEKDETRALDSGDQLRAAVACGGDAILCARRGSVAPHAALSLSSNR